MAALTLNREVQVRARIKSIYNKRQADFSALKEYNDYLEEVEDTIFNLCEGVDVRATEAKIEAYRRENASDIARRQRRNDEEDSRLRAFAGPGDGAVASARENAKDDDGVWKPRRMSDVSELDSETPGPSGFGGLFGYAPGGGSSGPGKNRPHHLVPVPARDAVPVPMSAGKMMEGGHGRHAHHAGWDDVADDPASRAKREARIEKACGVDLLKLGRMRATQEALTSVFC